MSTTKTKIVVTLAYNTENNSNFVPTVDDSYDQVAVDEDVTLTPYTHTPMLVINSGLDTVVSASTNERTDYTFEQVVRGLVTVTWNKLFHILLTNLLSKPIHILKRIVVEHKIHGRAHIIPT